MHREKIILKQYGALALRWQNKALRNLNGFLYRYLYFFIIEWQYHNLREDKNGIRTYDLGAVKKIRKV